MELKHAASVILAAGKGSRMTGYEGNKTLLPLVPVRDLFTGKRPLLVEVIENLPPGPKAVIVHHCKEDVIKTTSHPDVSFLEQLVPNGTGGAVLTARDFIMDTPESQVIVTMGDVPLIKKETYVRLLCALDQNVMVVLGFSPRERAQYGALEVSGNRVTKITEWKYWKDYTEDKQKRLMVFNAGIYAADRAALLPYLDRLSGLPHRVEKVREGRTVVIEEFFITDLVELLNADGLPVGFLLAESEEEVMGVDNPESLIRVQCTYGQGGKL
jgi:bifunctional UDP-N-acetylglucosamine pyrophosphorylase/glucosamine-1-phosphate N-acetyltransferase